MRAKSPPSSCDAGRDLYLIADVAALDERSRRILWAFSD